MANQQTSLGHCMDGTGKLPCGVSRHTLSNENCRDCAFKKVAHINIAKMHVAINEHPKNQSST